MPTVKHPEVTVRLSRCDGNAFAIIAACSKAARRASVEDEEIKAFQAEAMAGDYDNLLRTCMKYFDVR
jgi:hypothetical protein